MKSNLKKTLIYITISLISVIVIVSFCLSKIFSNLKKTSREMMMDSVSFSNQPYIEYKKDLVQLEDFQFKGTVYSKIRNPFEEFVYKNYYIFLCKLPVSNNKSLNDVLKTTYKEASVTSDVSYYDLMDDSITKLFNKYSLLFKGGKPLKGQSINFTLSGEHVKVLKKTDSSCSYYADLGNFSIRYNYTDTIDLHGSLNTAENAIPSLPIQITFKKKNSSFYLFLIIPNEHVIKTHDNLLADSILIK